MIRGPAAMMAGLLLLAGCAGGSAPPAKPIEPTPQAQSMRQMLADVNRVRAYVHGVGSRADAAAATEDLLTWSGQLRILFPPGRSAKDYVDMSPKRASDAPVAMVRAATQLRDAVARADDIGDVGDWLALTERNGCGACHLSYAH